MKGSRGRPLTSENKCRKDRLSASLDVLRVVAREDPSARHFNHLASGRVITCLNPMLAW